MTRGDRNRNLVTDVGGEAAPGFFERIRQREKLEADARSYMRNEQDSRRMLRNAYQKAVRRGEYDPSLLYAYNTTKAERDNINEKYKTGLRSDFDATMEYIRDAQDADKKVEPFSLELASLTDEIEKIRAEDEAAAEALRKKQEEDLKVRSKLKEAEEALD